MSKIGFAAAFALGLAAVAWVALGFVGGSTLALAVTLLIAGAYLLGAFELRQYRGVTRGLAESLAAVPAELATLDDWIARVPRGCARPCGCGWRASARRCPARRWRLISSVCS